MPEKVCCPRCFGDSGLEDRVFPTLRPEIGACSYCGSQSVQIVDPQQLSVAFEVVLDIYEPDTKGKPLSEWLRDDWGLFDHPQTQNPADAQVLLGDVLDDGQRARETYSPRQEFRGESAGLWDSLSHELRTANRWFPKSRIDEDTLGRWFDLMVTTTLQPNWFRARMIESESEPDWKELGAPPPEKATHGRANPIGIPCLYLASDENTAISEVRPHTGGSAWAGTFRVDNLSVIDLQTPRKIISPFKVDEVDQLGALRASMGLLEKLGAELAKPVQPHSAGVDYIPSQYLCEFIKSKGYDGVLYSSSVSEGTNLALFDPSKADCVDRTRFRVNRVTVGTDRID